MRRIPVVWRLLAAAVALATVAGGVVLAAVGSSEGRPPSVGGNLGLDGARRFRSFDLLYPGTRFDGLRLVRVDRRSMRRPGNGLSPPARFDYVSFKYGDCDASAGDCLAPLEIQVWPICLRNPSAYGPIDARGHRIGKADLAYEALRIRGVPAALYDAGTRLEVYTGSVAAVIFGARERIERAAGALRGVNRRVGSGDPLPAPSPASLTTNCV